ncbi:MAG: hypothetical protein GY710_06275 [Desulfobacteraceae bacterium]|nr:hypothetical protein [Desulfobacteraceae bacterium]
MKKENELELLSKVFDCIPNETKLNIPTERLKQPKISAIPAHTQSVMVFWNKKELELIE